MLGKFIMYKVLKWKLRTAGIKFEKKGIIVFAPHTSNWDFIIGRIAMTKLGLKPKFLIKSSLFFPPLGWLLKALGGLPVDRSKKNNLIDQIAEIFDKHESLYIVFTPEGTRSRQDKWKSGFYYAALKAKVPIYITFADYEKRDSGFLSVFYPTGNAEKDIAEIKSVYYGIKGKNPEQGVFPDED